MNPVRIYPDIYRIRLPLSGKKPGPVNIYLFKGKAGTAILDTGTALSWRHLESGLKKIGVSFENIDKIVLSHGHIDHYGAALKILKRSGGTARVYAHSEDAAAIETGSEVPSSSYINFLRLTGTPLFYYPGILPMFLLFKLYMAKNCPVHHFLKDNDSIKLGDYNARVIETPGHTRGSICFFLEKERLLFSGDHVLAHITPNAFPMLEADGPPKRSSQKEFYESLEKIRRLGPLIIHPAHGETIHDFSKVHNMYLSSFAERQEAILATIKNNPGRSVHGMALQHFPEIRKSRRFILELFLATSEIFTHIQVLEALGMIKTSLHKQVLKVEPVQ